MKHVVCGLLFLLALSAASSPAGAPASPDVVLRAMEDELGRTTQRLRLGELSPPYFVQYHAAEVEEAAYSASFGALVSATESRTRHLWTDVRVGAYSFDNSYFIDMSTFGGFRPSSGTTTIDDSYETLRQDLWLLTDGAYKTALEQLAQKRAYVQGQRRVSEVADFAQANPIVLLQPAAKLVKGSRNWEEELKTYSALCRAGMAVEKCEVSVRLTATTKYLVNSEGTRLRQGKTLAAFTAIVEALSEDGFRVNNFVTAYGRSPDELPPPEALHAKMENMLKELEAVRQVEELAHYSGPVLVTAPAAGPLLAGLLEGELDGGSPPQGLPEMALQRELQGRMNSRVLPEFLDVVDDPTQPEFNGQALLGLYEVDDEGVPAERVQLVEGGVLKSWLMSRRPGKDLAASNGHGRASLFGQAGAAPANLFVQSRAGIPARELEERFLELCREQGREFCLVVERLNDPSFIPRDVSDMRDMMAMAQMMMGGGGQGVPVLTVYKIYPEDGRREQVRTGMITGLRIRNLRDIVAAGDDYGVHNFLRVSMGGGGLFDRILGMFGAGQAGGGVGLPTAVVAPSLLFEELELRKGSEEPEKVRLVPRPKIGG